MAQLTEIVRRCETLFEDLHFNAVKAWKAAAPGRKAIGYMPIYVPRELIHAAGMLPVGIFGGGDQLEVIQGDAYYQSYICRIPRSTIELGLTGRLDCLDGMLFPSICDVIRNLSGMWQILFKDKYVRYFDVPQEYHDSRRRRVLRPRARDAARRSRRGRRPAGHRRRSPPVDRRLQRQPSRGPRSLCVPRAEALAGADGRDLSRAARRQRPAARSAHRARPRIPGRGRSREAPEARQRPRRRHRLVLRAAAARPDQVDRDGRLLHRRRRLHAHPALAARRRAGRREPAREPLAGVPPPLGLDRLEVRRAPRGQGQVPPRVGEADRRRGRDLRRRLASAIRRCSSGRCSRRCSPSTRFRTPRSSSRRTPARWRRSASRPEPSPIRSSCGAPHDQPHPASRAETDRAEACRAQAAGGEGRRDVAPEGAHQPQLPRARDRARRRPEDLRDVRAGQPQRAADVLRLRAQPARDQRAAERHAEALGQDDHGRRARRALRGRLHLREERTSG